jgi:hypothetical protein
VPTPSPPPYPPLPPPPLPRRIRNGGCAQRILTRSCARPEPDEKVVGHTRAQDVLYRGSAQRVERCREETLGCANWQDGARQQMAPDAGHNQGC